MDTTKESLLMAQDSRTRDAILFDMMASISGKIDKSNEIEDRVSKCENNITCYGRIGATFVALFSIIAGWVKFG